MIPYADDDMSATVSDWFDCADAFLLGRISGHLTDARGSSATPRLSSWPVRPQFVVHRLPPRYPVKSRCPVK